MRAARLIQMVLLLQNRRSMTAAELSEELEVSERTVARDALALSQAGIPVYADRGRAGGYRLIGGYRTRLTGLGRSEAEALFLSGVPSALRDMGLADAASAARLKVTAALAPGVADAAASAAQRFHLDAPGWWLPPRAPALLPVVAEAVWDDLRLSVRYRRRDGSEAERELEPYGLVLKAGVWYLAAIAREGAGDSGGSGDSGDSGGHEGSGHRVYRVDRLVEAALGEERFRRDERFDLAQYWTEQADAFSRSLLRERVVVRLTPAGAARLRHVVDRTAAGEALAAAGEADGQGRVTVTLGVESQDVAFTQLLGLGPDAEVVEPAALRERFAEAARRMAAAYR